ncbi:MAG TPA: VWA domain-containing protein, partial [Hyalangium sp.]|nr:VWA domain-containing protein [Hyalangium sp.]
NVFTAQVGNLLPNEETLVEVEFLQAIQVEEGSVRWMLPTLVAPRYIPGSARGDRTGHGIADPTTRVPDADRITPPIAMGQVAYGLKLDLLVDLGQAVVVESPSHALTQEKDGHKVRVKFARGEVALDRDFVLTVRSDDTSTSLTTVVTHRQGENPGTFALTVVPDLLGMAGAGKRQEVVFVVDTSGSMGGESLPQAQGALRLCLRHLREGDRFNIIAFENNYRSFSNEPVIFTQKTLEQADRWVDALRASGGTELLQPMLAAVQGVPDGVVVLLTDGQVGNEDEILRSVLGARKTTRVYSFGIGTNVSDVLLRNMAKQTGGAVEFIHPGERIDDKVVAQFSRALAPRVTEMTATFEGVEGAEQAPAELPPLVDAVPWTLFGRYPSPGKGKVILKGRSGQEPFSLTIPVDFPAASDRPVVEKLWAAERIRAWESAELDGRRAQRMKERIVQLAVTHQIVTKYTSFVVVEERTGERRASGQPDTRVVPVNAPAGWDMFGTAKKDEAPDGAFLRNQGHGKEMAKRKRAITGSMPAIGGMAPGGAPPPPAARPAPAPMAAAPMQRAAPAAPARPSKAASLSDLDSHPVRHEVAERVLETAAELDRLVKGRSMAPEPTSYADDDMGVPGDKLAQEEMAPAEQEPSEGADVTVLLSRQLASGLWAGMGSGPEPVRQARATALALLELLRQGITSNHPLHGAQVKKAVDALLSLASGLTGVPEVAELALGVAWLVAAGPRTRGRIVQAAQPLAGLSACIGDEVQLRKHVDTLAAR